MQGLHSYRSFSGPDHVLNYHEWMKNPDLLEATGSEPVSYHEEIEMQQTWLNDENKCTFIVHAPIDDCTFRCKDIDDDDDHVNKRHDKKIDVKESNDRVFYVEDNLSTMIGDVNLFLSEIDNGDDDHDNDENIIVDLDQKQQQNGKRKEDLQDRRVMKRLTKTMVAIAQREEKKQKLQAEIDIMIAKNECRRQGFAYTASIIMLLYGVKKLNVQRFFAKINEDNIPSIRLFQRLGFVQCNYAACFKQIEFELCKSSDDMECYLQEKLQGCYQVIPCGFPRDEKDNV